MKQYITLLAVLFTLLVTVMPFADPCNAATVEQEPNNTKTSAIPVNVGEEITGNIWHALDYDWYALNIARSGTLSITAYYNPPDDAAEVADALIVEIRDSQNRVIGNCYVDYSKIDQSNTLEFNIPETGIHYIVVYCPNQANFQRDKYHITVEYPEPIFVIDTSQQSIELANVPHSIPANGTSSVVLTATLKNSGGQPVAKGTSITFTTDKGMFPNGTKTFSGSMPEGGMVKVALLSDKQPGTASVTCSSKNSKKTVQITFTEESQTESKTADMTFSASPQTIPADGKTSINLSAMLYDSTGGSVPENTEVIFYASRGSFVNGLGKFSASLTDNSGNVSTSLISSTIKESSEVICYSQGVWRQISVNFGGSEDNNAAFLFLSTSKTSIKTNGTDAATITASVLDINKVPVKGTIVNFITTGGQISTSNPATDASGHATVEVSSGPDKTNQTVTITAVVQNLSGSIPILLSGSTVTSEIENTALQTGDDADSTTLTVTVKDGGDISVYNADVTISSSSSDNGTVTLTPASGTTNVNGKLEVTIKGEKPGDVTLNISALGSTRSQKITVSGIPFGIDDPNSNWISKNTDETQKIIVNSPDGNKVKFITSMGSWDNGETSCIKTPDTKNQSTATFHTGATAGTATIRVEDNEESTINDTLLVAVSAPSDKASKLSIQVAPSVIPPSMGDVTNVTTLKATVKSAANQIVSGAAVLFSLFRTTGGGETINPPIVYTGDNGEADSTFASGSLGSDSRGVFCLGKIAGAFISGPDSCFSFSGNTITRSEGDFNTDGFKNNDRITISGSNNNDGTYEITTVSSKKLTLKETLETENKGETLVIATAENTDVVAVKISGDGSSVAIGGATEIEALNPSTYKYPMSVLVADSNGNPVAGATISLSVWPTDYFTGVTGEDGPVRSAGYSNEDLNRNDILDPGEDTSGPPAGAELTADDRQINPAKSTAGTVPSTIITDASGVAQFDYVYQKNYAGWLDVEIKATTLVYGSENSSILKKSLSWMESEASSIPNSPWGPGPFVANLPTNPTALFTAEDWSEVYNKLDRTWHFTDNSTVPEYIIQTEANSIIISWFWDFGDGETSDEQHPEHTFKKDSVYPVTLTVENNSGETDTITKLIDTKSE